MTAAPPAGGGRTGDPAAGRTGDPGGQRTGGPSGRRNDCPDGRRHTASARDGARDAALRAAARGVLLRNWTGGYTVPSRTLYPHQWSWDSAFVAIGLRHLSPRRAQRELESLLAAQWDDGRLPQIVFDPRVPPTAYFPGPDFWNSPGLPGAPHGTGAPQTSGLIQPPIHAWAAWEVFRADPDTARRRSFLTRAYPRLVAWHRYLATRRADRDGLVVLLHPWESGMDNSPAWDGLLARVPPAPPERIRRPDLAHAPAPDRPTDLDYGRYVRLAADYRDNGCRDDADRYRFAVVEPLSNALLAASEAALADIAVEVGADPAPHRYRAELLTVLLVDGLYDAGASIFRARDVDTGRLIPADTVAGLAPLVVAGLPVAPSLVDTASGTRFRLGETCMPPSFDLTDARFDPGRYWRGPAWFNTGWLLWRGLRRHARPGLAAALRERMLDRAAASGFREYVDPYSGGGHGVTDFSWTAAVILDMLSATATATAAGTDQEVMP